MSAACATGRWSVWRMDGTLASKATFALAGEYFDDQEDKYTSRDDNGTGTTRPFGLGPQVPMYVVSPWSKGDWVENGKHGVSDPLLQA